jgi:hypothetical protein
MAAAVQAFDSLELTEEKINAITDKIPQRPVGVVEGTGYSIVILAAFGVSAAPHPAVALCTAATAAVACNSQTCLG